MIARAPDAVAEEISSSGTKSTRHTSCLAMRVCQQCGAAVFPGASDCPNCGALCDTFGRLIDEKERATTEPKPVERDVDDLRLTLQSFEPVPAMILAALTGVLVGLLGGFAVFWAPVFLFRDVAEIVAWISWIPGVLAWVVLTPGVGLWTYRYLTRRHRAKR